MKISACWIAKNEEKVLPRSIESVKGLADELVVVDTGSTDDTVALAKAAGARIEFFEWNGDFAAARNYALEQVSGDIVIFVDADEWFDPALGAGDRDRMVAIFADNPSLDALQLPIRNLNLAGGVTSTSQAGRILRKSPRLTYMRPVHEEYTRRDGSTLKSLLTDSWQLFHSGYTEDLKATKATRNLELLVAACESSTDPMDRSMHHMYLVREYHTLRDLENSLKHLNAILADPVSFRKQSQRCRETIAQIVYTMLMVGASCRSLVSRREIHRKIVEPYREAIANYPGAPTLELFYNACFNLKEDVLLEQIGPAIAAARKMTNAVTDFYMDAEIRINQYAAAASHYRGNVIQAMEYAVASFQYKQIGAAKTLGILLNCVKGQPLQEVVHFLNSQFDLSNPQKLEFLVSGTFMYGFRDVHAYYLAKKVTTSIGTKGDYLYLLQLYGQYEESVKAALEFDDESNRSTVNRSLFLAAICADNEQIYREHEERLSDYARILEAYFAGGILFDTTDQEIRILWDNYPPIVFANGFETGDRLLNVFSIAQPTLTFAVRTQYCVENHLYAEVLEREPPSTEDFKSTQLWIQCLVMTNRLEEAYDRITAFLDEGTVEDFLLQYLLIIADRATGGLKARARELYDTYIQIYDEKVDIADVVQTKYVRTDASQKRAKNYRSQTPAQFRKQLEQSVQRPKAKDMGPVYEAAGAIYEEQGLYAPAADCYRYAVSDNHNTTQNYQSLARVYRAMGNYQLGDELDKMAEL